MKRAALIFGISLLLATAGISCTSSDALQKALEDITDDDLAVMVLPADELGEDYEDLEVSGDESGHISNSAAAEDSFDTDTTAEDLEELGRISGYDLSYEDPDFLSLDSIGGLLGALTSVTLFEDAEGASAFLEKEKSDAEEQEGETEAGVRVESVETRNVDLADEATGMEFHASIGEVDIYGSAVYLRLDRLVGLAAVTRGDDEDVSGEVERIAGLLNERIRDVLLGDLSATPVPLPEGGGDEDGEVDDGTLDATPPADTPDLSTLALTPNDLPGGVTVSREGYAPDAGEAVAKFSREFDLSEVAGELAVANFSNDIELYDGAGQAGLNIRFLESFFTGQNGSDLLNSLFQDAVEGESGLETADFTVTPLAITAGDSATGYRASFDSAFGRFDAAFVAVQVDRVVGTISFGGLGADGDALDVADLANTLAERIQTGLAAQP
jgi:hypothetical protein